MNFECGSLNLCLLQESVILKLDIGIKKSNNKILAEINQDHHQLASAGILGRERETGVGKLG